MFERSPLHFWVAAFRVIFLWALRRRGETWEQPFVFDVPAFPLRKRARHSYGPEGSTTADGAKKPAAARNPLEMPPPPLPPFPDKRTYEDPSKKPRQKSSGDAKAVRFSSDPCPPSPFGNA
eukprot:scaffold1466_cov249-Pinguiococcus_pyrenoidosus.AAC.9